MAFFKTLISIKKIYVEAVSCCKNCFFFSSFKNKIAIRNEIRSIHFYNTFYADIFAKVFKNYGSLSHLRCKFVSGRDGLEMKRDCKQPKIIWIQADVRSTPTLIHKQQSIYIRTAVKCVTQFQKTNVSSDLIGFIT